VGIVLDALHQAMWIHMACIKTYIMCNKYHSSPLHLSWLLDHISAGDHFIRGLLA